MSVATKPGRKRPPLSPWKNKNPLADTKADAFPGVKSLNGKWGYPYVAPFIFMFAVFGMAPVIYSVYISFFQWDPLGDCNLLDCEILTYFFMIRIYGYL